METDGSYEIFKKETDNTTVLVEAVKGIEEAQQRLLELNEMGEERYFLFDPVKANVIEPSQPDVPKDPFAL